MAAGAKSIGKTFMWIIMGLLMLGLAGFGATNLSGTVRTVGHVGEQWVSVDDYARGLQQEIRSVEAQLGEPMTMAQARERGIDQQVLARLMAFAALDHEVAALGVSVGDGNLQSEVLQIPAFQGIDGKFDRDSYKFQLEQTGMREAEFEADLRAEIARTLVQGAILAGVEMPREMTDAMIDFIGARRSFTWARLDAAMLGAPLPEPTDAEARAFYDANPDLFTLPETKRLAYVSLSPEMLIDQVEVDEAELRTLFEERSAEYNIPERRLVERLVFPDENSANDAAAQLAVGGTTFNRLVEDRGLNLADVDMGDVTIEDLDAAGEAVFAAPVGNKVHGPFATDLGPALFRINGVLEARSTPFEDAVAELRDERAMERARRMIEAQAENLNDLLAGGATLDELADETDLVMDQIDWTENSIQGIAAYDAFRKAASDVMEGDFAEILFLEDGGVFAMELTEVLPPRPEPFEDASDRAAEGAATQALQTALQAKADATLLELATGGDFAAAGLDPRTETGLTRTAFLEETPPDFMNQVFEMEAGDMRVVAEGGAVLIVRLDEALPPEESEQLTQLADGMSDQLNQALAEALFEAFARDAQIRGRGQIDQRAVNAVLSSFQ